MPLTIAAIGHRPAKLIHQGDPYSTDTALRLQDFAVRVLQQHKPTGVISGMAQGWDQAVAKAALQLKLPLICAIPFPQQAARWTPAAAAEWAWIRGQASTVHYIAQEFSFSALQSRNIWMVNRADQMLALWDGSPGGTANCIRYAEQQHKPVLNLWDLYLETELF